MANPPEQRGGTGGTTVAAWAEALAARVALAAALAETGGTGGGPGGVVDRPPEVLEAWGGTSTAARAEG
jgi:hypothetical protein